MSNIYTSVKSPWPSGAHKPITMCCCFCSPGLDSLTVESAPTIILSNNTYS